MNSTTAKKLGLSNLHELYVIFGLNFCLKIMKNKNLMPKSEAFK